MSLAKLAIVIVFLVAAFAILWLLRLWLRARVQLRAQTRELQRLTDAQKMAGIGYWEYDIALGWLAWSDATLALFGIDRDAFDGSHADFIRRVYPEDQPRLAALREHSLQTGEALDVRYRIVRGDGGVRTLDEHGELHTRGDGRRVLLGTVRDVSTLVEAGQREQQQMAQYRYLFDRNPMPMAVYERGTLSVLAVNDAAVEMAGYTRTELLALRASDMLTVEERARFVRHIASSGPEHADVGVYAMQRKNAAPLRCRVFGQDILFDGHDARMVMLLDVTAAELAREALEFSEARLRLAARASHDAIWDFDIAAGTLWWNEGYTALFGYDAARSTPHLADWSARIHADDRVRVEASFAAALRGDREQWQEDYRYRHKDGQYIDVRDRGYILRDAAGHAVRMVGGMHDRSREVNAQRDLQQRVQNYRVLVEQMPTPLLVLQDGRVRMANTAAVLLLKGNAPESLAACRTYPRSSAKIVHPRARPMACADFD